jgi:NADPH:quinone reductase-like Zn-dependent oxidoreductase
MKAILYHSYGPPDVLKLEEVERPTPADYEVLIKVRAAAVNPLDWRLMKGKPYGGRIMLGLFRPKDTRPGRDVAGTVEAVGGNVTRFKPGDEVFGVCRGAFAEFACAPESKLVVKPEGVTFEQAASVPVAGLTALQGLRDKGRIRAGQKVLINGAAGGVGTFAVQIAKSFGADVTGVCGTRNVEMVRSIGADAVVDYTREDFTEGAARFDLILDCVGHPSLSACRRVLTPEGVCAIAGAPHDISSTLGLVYYMLKPVVLSRFVGQSFAPFMANINAEDLAVMCGLILSGKVTPVIDRRYHLGETPEAVRHVEEGHARGKVVINTEHGGEA